MFENIVSEVLTRYFGKYISGLNAENLRVSLWNGDVTLENLIINENAFDGLLVGVPLKAVSGRIGKMSLSFPWNKLDSQPVVVKINDIELVCTTDYNVDPSIISKQLKIEEQESKQRQLRNYEITSDKTTLTQRIITKVINNMQIDITNIHIRYEGINGWINTKYAIGSVIDSIKLYSTDSQWSPAFVVENQGDHFKIAEIIKMRIYHSQTKEDKWDTNVKKEYIVEDLTTKMRLTLSDKDDSYPITSQIILEMLKVGVSQGVMIDVKSLMQQQKLFEGKCFQAGRDVKRPEEGVEQVPKRWWKFAFDSLLIEVKKKNYKESNEYKRKRRALRQEYTDIYTRVLSETTDNGDKERFNELEEELSVKEIIYLRNFAKSEVDEAKRNSSGIWSWMGYSNVINSQLTEDIHSFLGDDNKEEKVTDTKKLKQVDFSFEAKQFVIDLFGSDLNEAFVEIEISALNCSVFKKTIGFTANIDLNDAKVKSNKDNKYPYIFSSINNEKNLLHIKLTSEKEEEKVDSDFSLDVHLEPTNIVYNKNMAEELMNVVRSLDVVESYGQIGVKLPSMNLKSILDEHIRVVISAMIHTPYIIIHSDNNELHIDLGVVKMLTNERNGIYDSYKLTINDINCKMITDSKSEILLEKTQMSFDIQKALLSWKEMKEKLNELSPGVIVDCLLDTTKLHISSEQIRAIRLMFKNQKPKPKTEHEAIRDLLQQEDDLTDIGDDTIIQIPEDFIKLKLTVSIPEATAFISLTENEPIFNVSAKQLTMTSIVKDKKSIADISFGDVIVVDNDNMTFFSKKHTNESLVSLHMTNENDKPITITLFATQSMIYFDLPHLDHILHFLYSDHEQKTIVNVPQKKTQSKVVQVSFVFTSIELVVRNRGSLLASGSAVGGSFDILIDGNNPEIDITVKGSLKRVFAKDETMSGKIHSIVVQTVDTPIDILYTHAITQKAIQQDYRHYLSIKTDQMTCTYLNIFIQQLYSWLQDLLHICRVRVCPSNEPSHSYDRLKLDADITNVSLCIPVASYIEDGIKLITKQLQVRSTWIQNQQSTKSLTLYDIYFDENVSAKEITFNFTFPDEMNVSVDFPAWDISLSIPSGYINLTKERYREIVGLIMINLGELSKHQDLIKYHPVVSPNQQELSDIRNRIFTADIGSVEVIVNGEEEIGIMKFDELKYKYLSLPHGCSLHTVEIKSGSFIDHLNKDELLFWVEGQKKIDNFMNFAFETAEKEKTLTLSFGHSSHIRLTQETLLKLVKFFSVESKYLITESGFAEVVETTQTQPERTFIFKFLMNEINFHLNDKQGDFMLISLLKSSIEMKRFKEDTNVFLKIGTLKAVSDDKVIISISDEKEMGTFEYIYEKRNELSMFKGSLSQIHIVFYDKVIIRGAQYYEQLVKILSALKGKTVQFIEQTATVSRKIRLNFVIEAPKIDIGEVTAQLGIVTITDKPGTLNKLEIIGNLSNTKVNIDKDEVVKCEGVTMEVEVIDADDGYTDVGIDADCKVIDICTTPQNLTSLLKIADMIIKTSQQIQLPK
ncbi:hypothetical protein EDI_342180 [Entamoeba dispar SAW760]|uniref:Chorein N-terminal domain-containing protein n=1 Tax=Entamoeba dispar (strain ATCC PRA-260 / SAW760) TaxID=370354 RepID=B0E9Q0_ENTDS|nr:uncharacterized protein EDI_342180 [Entamoeba dispar SAW760]EDR28768.1 hypothetical protein EDI_342180 [Entamoeba dispar SAW760]|eukprot:EDR28768.1 hypothetical protein EDI_342180 [Entamoeba dispar SAW760]